MAQILARGGESPERSGAVIRWLYVCGGSTYPIWHLLAPRGAIDPWWLWWLVGSCFGLAALMPRRALPASFYYWPSGLVAIHLFGLAALNGMRPFYLNASVATVVTTVVFLRHRLGLLFYAGLICLLSVSLYLVHRSQDMLVYGFVVVSLVIWSYAANEADRVREERRERHAQQLELAVGDREQRLRRASDRISHEVFERRRLEQELQVAQSMSAVARLAGAVAHEFNNQLMTVRVFADLLKSRLDDEEALEDLGRIIGATVHGARLTRQILTLCRPVGVAPDPVDVGAAVRSQLPALRKLLPPSIRVVSLLEKEPVFARVDAHELVQVILNLAINAGDAMPQGGDLRIEVGAVASAGLALPGPVEARWGDEVARLSVSDTGVGIPAAHRDRIFEPFFTTKARDAGSGMGLAVVWGIVTRHGGHVRVESEMGRGTRFELYWPRAWREVRPGAPALAAKPIRGAGQRILLVDDEPDVLAGLARVLGEAGYDVVMAADGESALRLFSESPCDLIATDAVMPGMGGVELLEKARGLRLGVPGLIFSGHLGGAARPQLEDVPVLHKPFEPDAMLRSIRELMAAAGGQRRTPPAPRSEPGPAMTAAAVQQGEAIQ